MRQKYTDEQKKRLYEELKASGMSTRTWCEQKGISPSVMWTYAHRLKLNQKARTPAVKGWKPGDPVPGTKKTTRLDMIKAAQALVLSSMNMLNSIIESVEE